MTCKYCRGHGYITTIDYVDYGSTTVPLEQSWVCDCVNDGYCPECNELIDAVGYCNGCDKTWDIGE